MLAISRVRDGDTFEAWILVAPNLAQHAPVRLLGVDTPEMRGVQRPRGLEAKEFVARIFEDAKFVTLDFAGTDKYGRWLCDVWVDGKSLAEMLRKAGHVKEAE